MKNTLTDIEKIRASGVIYSKSTWEILRAFHSLPEELKDSFFQMGKIICHETTTRQERSQAATTALYMLTDLEPLPIDEIKFGVTFSGPIKKANPYHKNDSRHFKFILWGNTRSGERPCHWCECHMLWEDATIEHLNPVADFGKTVIGNLALACHDCNGFRGMVMEKARRGVLSWRAAAKQFTKYVYAKRERTPHA